MAEIYYRYSENEFLAFTKYILSRGCYLVSDILRATPDMINIHDYDEMLQYWEWIKLNPAPGSPGLFILHHEYQKYPLSQSSIFKEDTGQVIYSINQRYGGPSIDLSYYPSVGKGTLSHYSYYYYETEDYFQIRPPEVMIQFYKDFTKYIRKTTLMIKYYNRRVYCGQEYIQQVIEGAVKVEEDFREIVLNMNLINSQPTM